MLSYIFILTQLLFWTYQASATSPPTEQRPGRKFLPSQDWSLDRNDLKHLVPGYSSRLIFLEQPRSSLAMSTTMTMIQPAVILENSASVKSLRCSENGSITLELSSMEAFERTQEWPVKDLVLVTNRLSCNPADERGVFLTRGIDYDLDRLALKIQARAVSWKDVAKTMTIDYLEIDAEDDVEETSESTRDQLREEL
ncbi:hypothetical protein E4T49_07958 [Aureobasidium sp. EXF-10728]|nr:hypothetical protein E4T49_07958 [Aureobasidium sp. EXF-10728]